VKQFKAIPTVRQHLLKGDVALYGLFFMSESASFLAYDDDQKSFLPLYP
jgi:hypothetical protein